MTSPRQPERSSARGRRWILPVVVAAALVVGAGWGWRWHRLPERVRAALPATPERVRPLPGLAERIEAAEAKLAERDQLLEGVGELGRVYHANGYMEAAATCWTILQAEQPQEARWAHYLADARRALNDQAGARAALERTVALQADYAPAWLQLANLAFKTGDASAATAAFHRRLELVPGDPHARLGLARLASQAGRVGEARQQVEALVRDEPAFAPAQNLYAEMLAAEGQERAAARHRWLGREAGRFREADDPWLRELEAWCHDPERLHLLGTVYYQTRQLEAARATLERAVNLAPTNPTGILLLGELYLKLGEPDRAREILEQGTRLAEQHDQRVMMQVDLAEAHRLLKDFPTALDVVDAGLVFAPQSYELHNTRGAVLAELGRHEEAVAAYRTALAQAPNDADTNYSLGVSLLALNRRDEAVVVLRHSLILRPTYPKSLLVLSRLALEDGDLDALGDYVRPLYEFHPGQQTARQLYAEWRLRSGQAAEQAGDQRGAEEHYELGIEADPARVQLHANLGVLRLVQGKVNEALASLEAYRQLEPTNPHAALFLGQAYARLGRLPEARDMLRDGARLATEAGNESTAAFCREILRQLGG